MAILLEVSSKLGSLSCGQALYNKRIMSIGINFKFPIKGDVNNTGIVKNAMGGVCVFSLGYTALQWSKSGFQKSHIGTLLLGSVAGAAYLYLDNRDNKREDKVTADKYKHEETIARIKHPKESSGADASNDTETPNYSTYDMSELKNSDIKLSPMIGQFLPENYDSLVYGEKGTMKSLLVLSTMIQLGMGEVPQILPPDHRETYTPISNVRCVYVDGENGKVILKERYGATLSKLGFIKVIEAQTFGNGGDKLFQTIREAIKGYPGGTKIFMGIDNLKSVANEFSSGAGKELLNNLKKLREDLNQRHITLTTMIIHHTDKTGKQASGSYTLPCLTPFVFKLEYDVQKQEHTLVIQESRTYRKGDRYLLEEVQGDYLYLCNAQLMNAMDKPKVIINEEDDTPSWDDMIPWKIPLELALEIGEFYQEGVNGRGLSATIKEFGLEEYGIKDSTQLRRLLNKLSEYLE